MTVVLSRGGAIMGLDPGTIVVGVLTLTASLGLLAAVKKKSPGAAIFCSVAVGVAMMIGDTLGNDVRERFSRDASRKQRRVESYVEYPTESWIPMLPTEAPMSI